MIFKHTPSNVAVRNWLPNRLSRASPHLKDPSFIFECTQQNVWTIFRSLDVMRRRIGALKSFMHLKTVPYGSRALQDASKIFQHANILILKMEHKTTWSKQDWRCPLSFPNALWTSCDDSSNMIRETSTSILDPKALELIDCVQQ